MDIENCKAFPHYLKMSQEVSDKVGFLTCCFKRLHPHAPKEDFVNLGGRIARLWVNLNRDTGYCLQVIWDSSSKSPNGSHLNYMQAIIQKKVKLNNQPQPVAKLKRVN
jgi:hypothetical protein